MAKTILELPHEVLHSILTHVAPTDLTSLRCCHALDNHVKHDGLLFKEIYARHFVSSLLLLGLTQDDEPSKDAIANNADVDWKAELRDLVRFQKMLSSSSYELKVATSGPYIFI